jgi:hypothetical protein
LAGICTNKFILSARSVTMATLEEELGIPMDATLVVPPQLPSPLCLSFITPQQQFLESVTLFNPLSQSDPGKDHKGGDP